MQTERTNVQRCRSLLRNPRLVGGTTVPAGTFSFMSGADYYFFTVDGGLTCQWAITAGGATALDSVFCSSVVDDGDGSMMTN